MTKSLSEWAREALAVQDACNLSGVVRTWARMTEDLWDAAREGGHGTEWVNCHPLNKLFADKVAHLTGRDGKDVFTAYDWARRETEGL